MKLKDWILALGIVGSATAIMCIVGYIFMFHWNNPQYTEMMLFQKFWKLEILGFLNIIAFSILNSIWRK